MSSSAVSAVTNVTDPCTSSDRQKREKNAGVHSHMRTAVPSERRANLVEISPKSGRRTQEETKVISSGLPPVLLVDPAVHATPVFPRLWRRVVPPQRPRRERDTIWAPGPIPRRHDFPEIPRPQSIAFVAIRRLSWCTEPPFSSVREVRYASVHTKTMHWVE